MISKSLVLWTFIMLMGILCILDCTLGKKAAKEETLRITSTHLSLLNS